MADAKYIILKELQTQHSSVDNVPIIFADIITHKQMASNYGGKDNISGAGFVSICENEEGTTTFEAYGESVSLEIKSQDVDSKIIKRMFRNYD